MSPWLSASTPPPPPPPPSLPSKGQKTADVAPVRKPSDSRNPETHPVVWRKLEAVVWSCWQEASQSPRRLRRRRRRRRHPELQKNGKTKKQKKNAFVLQLISFVSIHPSDKPFFLLTRPPPPSVLPLPRPRRDRLPLPLSLSLSSRTPLTSMVAGEREREEGRRRRGGRKKDEVASRIYRCGSCGCRRCINVLGRGCWMTRPQVSGTTSSRP